MRSYKKKSTKGQSLFEVVLSLAVITVVVVALIILASNAIRNTTFSKNRTLATRSSQEAMEWLRGERDADWDAFSVRALIPTYCLPSLSWTQASIGTCSDTEVIAGTLLKREISFTSVAADNIEVNVIVYWEDAQGLHEVRSATNLTDWRVQ